MIHLFWQMRPSVKGQHPASQAQAFKIPPSLTAFVSPNQYLPKRYGGAVSVDAIACITTATDTDNEQKNAWIPDLTDPMTGQSPQASDIRNTKHKYQSHG